MLKLAHAEWIPFVAVAVAVVALLVAWFLYASPKAKVQRALDETNRSGIYKIIYHKFYFDEMYYTVVRQFIFGGIARVARAFNDYVIEGLLAFGQARSHMPQAVQWLLPSSSSIISTCGR